MHFIVLHVINLSLCTAMHPAKLRDRWVGLLSPFSKCRRNQNIFHRADEICLKQGRSNKAAVGNTSISFSKLLFSHAVLGGGGIIASQM